MPVERLRVRRVLRSPTEIAGVARFDVSGELDGTTLTLNYETTNPWLASLCERFQRDDAPVNLAWKDSRYGKQIVSVEKASMNALIDRCDAAFCEIQNALQEVVDECEAVDKNSDAIAHALTLVQMAARQFTVLTDPRPDDPAYAQDAK